MFDQLFTDSAKFIEYMRENDSEATRAKMLRTDELRLTYCACVCLRQDVFESIDKDSAHTIIVTSDAHPEESY